MHAQTHPGFGELGGQAAVARSCGVENPASGTLFLRGGLGEAQRKTEATLVGGVSREAKGNHTILGGSFKNKKRRHDHQVPPNWCFELGI